MKTAIALLISIILIGCATTQQSKLNQYTIERSIVKGKTTKQEILNIFGAPNIVTKPADYMPKIDSKDIKIEMPPTVTADEIWTYSQSSMNAGGNYASILLLGGFGTKTSIKSVMLTIYLNKEGIVQDYTITTSQF